MDYDFQRGQYKFTKIKIEKIIKNLYAATFNALDTEQPVNIEFNVSDTSPQNCIEKLEKMFNVTFEPQDWSLTEKERRV